MGKKLKVRGVIRRMVPQVAIYETEVELDDEELEYLDDYLDQFFNDDVQYDHKTKINWKTVDEDAQEYLKEHFCSNSTLDFQCVEYTSEFIVEGSDD